MSAETISIFEQLYFHFTGKSIKESNFYRFIERFGDDDLVQTNFGYDFMQPEIRYRYKSYVNGEINSIYHNIGFREFGYLFNYFGQAICCTHGKRKLTDEELADPIYKGENYTSYLRTYPYVKSFIISMHIKPEQIFKPLHIRDLFNHYYNEIKLLKKSVQFDKPSEYSITIKQL